MFKRYYFLSNTGKANGGGGAGGRIAIYHRDRNHFTGDYLIHGGKGTYYHGGAGTLYIESQNVDPAYRLLRIDNRDLSASNRIYHMERLNLTADGLSWRNFPDMLYQSSSGVNVTTTARPFYLTHLDGTFYNGYPLYCVVDRHFEHRLRYYSRSTSARLEFYLPFKTYVDHIKIYPYGHE